MPQTVRLGLELLRPSPRPRHLGSSPSALTQDSPSPPPRSATGREPHSKTRLQDDVRHSHGVRARSLRALAERGWCTQRRLRLSQQLLYPESDARSPAAGRTADVGGCPPVLPCGRVLAASAVGSPRGAVVGGGGAAAAAQVAAGAPEAAQQRRHQRHKRHKRQLPLLRAPARRGSAAWCGSVAFL